MGTLIPTIDEEPGARLPLRITVSPAGQHAALNALVGQCVPMLQHPEAFPPQRRRELAERLVRAIQPRSLMDEMDEVDASENLEIEPDPMCWIEDDQ